MKNTAGEIYAWVLLWIPKWNICNCWDRDDNENSGQFLVKIYIDKLIYIDDNTYDS